MGRDFPPVAFLIGVLSLSLIFAIPFLTNFRPDAPGWYGMRVAEADESVAGPLVFRDDRGDPVRITDFRGRYVFLFFGYTRCADSCPVWLSRLLRMAKVDRNRLHVIFLSIDGHEPPLDGFLADLRDVITPIPAGQKAIYSLAGRLGYRFDRTAADGEVIQHADAVYLFDRHGRLRIMYPYRWLDPRRLDADLQRLDREDGVRIDR